MSAGITAGARGAAAGLGQASAGNARTLPRPRKPGLKSKSRGLETRPEPRWSAERRARPKRTVRIVRGARRARGADRWQHLFVWCGPFDLRLPALRLPFILFGGETSVAFVLAAKLGREARRENALALPSPAGGGSRPEGTRGGVRDDAGISSALRALSPQPATLRVHSRCFASAFLGKKDGGRRPPSASPSRGR